jgi:RNA polymerase sigma factor (sigma-70 family)
MGRSITDARHHVPYVSTSKTEQARWFAEEVQPHEPALRAYLRSRFPTLQNIDDLVQEAYARLVRAKNAGSVTHPKAYLFTTARNAALDLFRRDQVISIQGIAQIETLSVLEEGPNGADHACHVQELEILSEAIRALPERCRQIFTMRKLQELSHREIALALGISEHTVNAQLAIGILRCRDYLRARGMLKGAGHVDTRS